MRYVDYETCTVDRQGRTRFCASCRRGYDGGDPDTGPAEAEVFVRGKQISQNGNLIPYRGYLCKDHYRMMEDDGAVFKTVVSLKTRNDFKAARLDDLTVQYTAYETFEEMCKNTPTLRLDVIACPTSHGVMDIMFLRKCWEEVAGKPAYPQYTPFDWRKLEIERATTRLGLDSADVDIIIDVVDQDFTFDWSALTRKDAENIVKTANREE